MQDMQEFNFRPVFVQDSSSSHQRSMSKIASSTTKLLLSTFHSGQELLKNHHEPLSPQMVLMAKIWADLQCSTNVRVGPNFICGLLSCTLVQGHFHKISTKCYNKHTLVSKRGQKIRSLVEIYGD